MRRPRIAINAAVLATPIGIQARLETDIRAVITRDDRFRAVTKILCRALLPIFFDKIDIANIDMELFETIRRTPRRATAVDGRGTLRRFFNERQICPFRRIHCNKFT